MNGMSREARDGGFSASRGGGSLGVRAAAGKVSLLPPDP